MTHPTFSTADDRALAYAAMCLWEAFVAPDNGIAGIPDWLVGERERIGTFTLRESFLSLAEKCEADYRWLKAKEDGELADCDFDWTFCPAWLLNCSHLCGPGQDGVRADALLAWRSEQAGKWCVAIMLHDYKYGGPEEGGWWYSTQDVAPEFAEHTKWFASREDAAAYRQSLEDGPVAAANVGRPPISSVTSIGRYGAVIERGSEPGPDPKARPTYE